MEFVIWRTTPQSALPSTIYIWLLCRCKNEAFDRDAKAASDHPQFEDTLVPDVFALVKLHLRIQHRKSSTHRSGITDHWNPTRSDPTLTQEGEGALARLRAGASHRWGLLLQALRPTRLMTSRWCNPIEPLVSLSKASNGTPSKRPSGSVAALVWQGRLHGFTKSLPLRGRVCSTISP
ncbi:Tbingi protein [Trypanosoma grayi]|uniref:Tbingi protein n=1 Tax=Trypanosoma grayi TaxID=71804 RepID=UPI0004F4843E|nr:Tbingi protein [Trypanosoma grayi]KEG08018.1 Tbingi protein [Trypanosoma grayi]